MKKFKKKAFFDNGGEIYGSVVAEAKQLSLSNAVPNHEAPSVNLGGGNKFEFVPSSNHHSQPFEFKASRAHGFSNGHQPIPTSGAMSAPFSKSFSHQPDDDQGEYSDVFDIDDEEIFDDLEAVDHQSDRDVVSEQSSYDSYEEIGDFEDDFQEPVAEAKSKEDFPFEEPSKPAEEPKVDTSKAEADEQMFNKINRDRQQMTTYQLGEVEVESEFDMFDNIIDKPKTKAASNGSPVAESLSELSEMDIAEDFELMMEKMDADVEEGIVESFSNEGTPIVLNVTRVFEDDVAALSMASISGADKSLKFYMITDKAAGNKVKDGAYKTYIKLPSQINERNDDGTSITHQSFINRFKGMATGQTNKAYPVFHFYLDYIKGGGEGLSGPIPPGGIVTGHAGNSHHDSLGCEVFGDTLSIDYQLKELWEAKEPGVVGHYVQIENSRKTLEKIFDFIADIYEQDKKEGKVPVITSVFNTNLVSTKGDIEYMLRDGQKVPAAEFYEKAYTIIENKRVMPGQSRDSRDL